MTVKIPFLFAGNHPISLAAVAALGLLAACGTPPVASGINDPMEPTNRAIHGLNKGLDRVLVRPGSKVYGAVVPGPVRQGVSNLSDTLDLPGDIVNDVLQGNVEDAGSNFARLAVNVVFGLGGLLDVATDAGIPRASTDFGETLHVWGAPEGAFLVVPLAGPTTERDLVGKVVDFVIDPMNSAFPEPEKYYVAAGKLAGKVADRQRYGDVIDDILYGSADSYAQMRLMYLQNRHYELGIEAEVFDPYEDPYGQ